VGCAPVAWYAWPVEPCADGRVSRPAPAPQAVRVHPQQAAQTLNGACAGARLRGILGLLRALGGGIIGLACLGLQAARNEVSAHRCYLGSRQREVADGGGCRACV